jgi:hypothetical protein
MAGGIISPLWMRVKILLTNLCNLWIDADVVEIAVRRPSY